MTTVAACGRKASRVRHDEDGEREWIVSEQPSRFDDETLDMLDAIEDGEVLIEIAPDRTVTFSRPESVPDYPGPGGAHHGRGAGRVSR